MIDPNDPTREEAVYILEEADKIGTEVGMRGLESRAQHLRDLAADPSRRTNGQFSIALAVFHRHFGLEWLTVTDPEQSKKLTQWAMDLMAELKGIMEKSKQ